LPAPVSQALLRNVRLPGIGLIVSNVRGPDVPLYMAGAQLVNYSPISIAVDGMGLNVTGFSYNGTMWICAVSCREMMPDPAFYAECLRSSFAELKEAAERHAAAAAEDAEEAEVAAEAQAAKTRKAVAARPAKHAAAKPRVRTVGRKTAAKPRRRRNAAAVPKA